MQHGDDLLLGLSQLGPLSRMAPQPHMMSDLCSSHQSVTTRTVQQLHNCGFGISDLTGTKSPHLVSSQSDLLTPSRHALLRRRLSALAGSWVGARCATQSCDRTLVAS